MITRGKIRTDLTHDGAVARVTLASPKANILDRKMMLEFVEALSGLEWSGRLKVIIIASEGPHFSFGASIEEHLPDQIGRTLVQLKELLRALLLVPAPTIAAVRGQCLGGGFELALACDLVIAEETAQFALPEIKLGVFPPAGAALLPLRIGASRAADMVITGTSMVATEAKATGLVQRIAAAGDLEPALDRWLASDFLPRSSAALRYAAQASRRPLLHALDHELPAIEDVYLNGLMQQPEAVEGLLAFLEKRQPRWKMGPAA